MHARVLSIQTRPGKVDEVLKIFHESVLPIAKEQKGARAGVILKDPDTNRIMTVTLWNTEDDMLAGETGDYLRDQIAKVAPLLEGQPQREHFQVDTFEVIDQG